MRSDELSHQWCAMCGKYGSHRSGECKEGIPIAPLYGKIGNRTFDTGKTSANWDAMVAALKSAKECIEANRRHIESMGRHAVEGTSATLDEISNALMPNARGERPGPNDA